MFKTAYRDGTLREKLFGRGPRLPASHPAARHRRSPAAVGDARILRWRRRSAAGCAVCCSTGARARARPAAGRPSGLLQVITCGPHGADAGRRQRATDVSSTAAAWAPRPAPRASLGSRWRAATRAPTAGGGGRDLAGGRGLRDLFGRAADCRALPRPSSARSSSRVRAAWVRVDRVLQLHRSRPLGKSRSSAFAGSSSLCVLLDLVLRPRPYCRVLVVADGRRQLIHGLVDVTLQRRAPRACL